METDLDNVMPAPSKKVQAVEVTILVMLIFPSMIMAPMVTGLTNLSFSLLAWSSIISDTALLGLVLYFVWRNNEPFHLLGLTRRDAWKEAAVGAVLFLPLVFGVGLMEKGLRAAGLSVPQEAPSFLVPSGASQTALALLLLVVVAVSEEVIFRGYLIRRFTVLFKNPAVAVVISSVIFAVGHGYQRAGGMVGVGILGLIFGTVYLWRKSLAAPIAMHFLQNFVGLILVPYGGAS